MSHRAEGRKPNWKSEISKIIVQKGVNLIVKDKSLVRKNTIDILGWRDILDYGSIIFSPA